MDVKSETERWDGYYQKHLKEVREHQAGLQHWEIPPSDVSTALDIGCGTGHVVRAWATKSILATGIDVSTVAIRNAEKLVNPLYASFCRFMVADWLEMSEQEFSSLGKYDFVFSSMGPDWTNPIGWQRLLQVSKKYCRLLLFKEGHNTIMDQISDTFGIKEDLMNPIFEKIVYKLRSTGYKVQLTEVKESAYLRLSLRQWCDYANRVFPQLNKDELIPFLKSLSDSNLIRSRTSVTYIILDWRVDV